MSDLPAIAYRVSAEPGWFVVTLEDKKEKNDAGLNLSMIRVYKVAQWGITAPIKEWGDPDRLVRDNSAEMQLLAKMAGVTMTVPALPPVSLVPIASDGTRIDTHPIVRIQPPSDKTAADLMTECREWLAKVDAANLAFNEETKPKRRAEP